jgi:Interferon-induced transmembrane protein
LCHAVQLADVRWARGSAMTGADRPQDPIPPEYQTQAADTSGPAFQTYQPYPAGYPAYQGYQNHYYPPQGMPPPNHLGWAIAAILLFWPVGIAAIIKSTQVDRYWMMGQHGLAEQASRTTRTLGIVSLVVAGSLVVLWFLLFFVFFAGFIDQIPAPPR